jgi:NADH-quinone oxidoreductase subunit L
MSAALVAAPLLAALIGFAVPAHQRRIAAAVGSAGAAVALVLAVMLAFDPPGDERGPVLARFGDLAVRLTLSIDRTAALVAIAVGTVALAVQVYSSAYLHGDDRYGPYAAQISLFTSAMLLVVSAGDLILLLIGWEVMGICSYLLIAHDRRLPEAPRAAVKAFLVTRLGDVGFFLGVVLFGLYYDTFEIAPILGSDARYFLPPLLLLAGIAGKSAQFPLHTWLPDAMAGPTPISALIHAATMVAAGVYVLVRLFPLYAGSADLQVVIALMASITMLLAALAATAQDDIKRVLAWSTVSQLGYMVGAIAVLNPDAALFHLLTHAAFKALLFLAAGAVIHAVGTNLMSSMGGLRHKMPVTFWSMTIGLGALAGIPPLSGFWSKELILASAEELHEWPARLVLVAGFITVFLTAWYATRLWLLTFFGPPAALAGPTPSGGAAHAHEPPKAMLVPVVVLAIPSAVLGFIGQGFTDTVIGVAMLPAIALSALGVTLAWLGWRRVGDPVKAVPGRQVFANAFYLDAVQDALVTRPAVALARAVRRGDESIVDGAVEAAGTGTRGLGGVLARVHRAGLPRAATAALAGALVIGVAAAWFAGGS